MTMKDSIKKVITYIGGLNGVLCILYTSLILSSYAFVSKLILPDDIAMLITGFRMALFVRSVGIIVVGAILVCPLILRKVKTLSMNQDEKTYDKKWFLYLFVIIFLVMFLHYLAYYPGGFSQDTITQYQQAISNQYSDWHPVFQTLFAIKLPLVLMGGWIGSIVLWQILLFSLTLAYGIYQLLQYTNKTFAIGSLLFILLNPTTTNVLMFPWKDTSFLIGTFLLTIFAMQIFFTKGAWCEKKSHLIFLILTISFTTLFRHNAILFTLTYILAVLFSLPKKKVAVLSVAVLAIVLGVKYPLYHALKVEKPENRQVETLGLPMTVIGATAKYDFDSLDEETKEFVLKVAPKEVWEEAYVYGSFNLVKYREETNVQVIEEYGTKKVLSMMKKCFQASPISAMMGFIRATDGVYSVSENYLYAVIPNVEENDVGIEQGGIGFLQTINYYGTAFMAVMFPHVFTFVGTIHLAFVVIILAKYKLNRWEDWKKIFYVLPIFAYNFGSMLFLSHYGDVYRYFCYTFLLVPMLLGILLVNCKERSSSLKKLEK